MTITTTTSMEEENDIQVYVPGAEDGAKEGDNNTNKEDENITINDPDAVSEMDDDIVKVHDSHAMAEEAGRGDGCAGGCWTIWSIVSIVLGLVLISLWLSS